MVTNSTGQFGSLENRTATLFLVAGVLFVFAAVNNSLVFFTDGYDPSTVSSLLLLVGLVAALLGLVGMYSPLRERTPQLAQSGLGSILLAVMAVIIRLLWALGNVAGLVSDFAAVIVLVVLVLIILGFVLFGMSVLRATTYPQLVGVLLLAVAVALALAFVFHAMPEGELPMAFGVGIEGILALLFLGIGYSIRQARIGVDRRELAPDTTD